MNYIKIHYWPICASLWILVTFLISYAIAVATKTVIPFLPYISETGAFLPASCFFSQLLNIGALLTGFVLYARYRQIDLAIKALGPDKDLMWNNLSFWLGLIIAFGMSMVANFQDDHTAPRIILTFHIIGAALSFGLSGVYMAIQTKITVDLQPFYDAYPTFAISKLLQRFREFLTFCYFVSLANLLVFGFVAAPRFEGGSFIYEPKNVEYTIHMVSVVSEWLLVFFFIIYISTITKELKALSFEGVHFKLREEVEKC